jgi:hypothetical protein
LEDSYKNRKPFEENDNSGFLRRGKGSTASKTASKENVGLTIKVRPRIVSSSGTGGKSPTSPYQWSKPISNKESILPSFRQASPISSSSPKLSTPKKKKTVISKLNSSTGSLPHQEPASPAKTLQRPSTAPTKKRPTKETKQKTKKTR